MALTFEDLMGMGPSGWSLDPGGWTSPTGVSHPGTFSSEGTFAPSDGGAPQVGPKTAADVLAALRNGTLSPEDALAALKLLGYTDVSAKTFLGIPTGTPTASPTFTGERVGGQPVSGSLIDTTPAERRQTDLLALIQDPNRAFEQLFATSAGQPGTLLNRSMFNFLGEPAKAGFRLAPFLRDIPLENLGSFQLADFAGGGLPSQQDIVNAFRRASGDPAGMTGSRQVRATALQQDPSQEMQEAMFGTAFGPWLARSGSGFRNELSRFLEQQFNRFRQESPGLNFLQELGQNRLPQFRGFGGF